MALGHWQSPEDADCSSLLSHRRKSCGSAVSICLLVLEGEQGPDVSLE